MKVLNMKKVKVICRKAKDAGEERERIKRKGSESVFFANQNMLENRRQVASLPAETLAWVDSQRNERKCLLEGLPGCM